MQEIIHCPSCQRKLQVPETLLGQDVQCPTCGSTFVASWGNQGTAPPPPRAFNAPPPSAPPPYGAPQPPYGAPQPPPPPYQRGEYAPNDYADYDDYNDRGDQPRRYRSRRDLAPHRGSTILTLGILSLIIAPIILGPIAWIMGSQDMAEIKAGRMDPEGESSTNTGRICGMIATIFYGALILLFCTCMIPAMMHPGAFR